MSKQIFYGSLNLTEILKAAKDKHSAFKKAENGNIYIAVKVWESENDKFGNAAGIQLAPAKDSNDQKTYIGNFKTPEPPKEVPITDSDIPGVDDLPF